MPDPRTHSPVPAPPPKPTPPPPPPPEPTWLSKYGSLLTPVVLVAIAVIGPFLALWNSVTELNVSVANVQRSLNSIDARLDSLDVRVKELHDWHLDHIEKHHVSEAEGARDHSGTDIALVNHPAKRAKN